jgi:Kef-type K+ transport system membrane component KefB
MEFLPFFLILLATVLFAAAFRRFHLPWVLALITAGVVVGPYGFGFAEVTPTLSFLSQIGLIFLMFMAGLETKFDSIKKLKYNIGWLSALNSLIPFAAGIALGYWFEFSLTASLLIGVIFMSSSIAVIIPTLESLKLNNTRLGKSIVASTVIEDVLSLVLLSILLQSVNPITALPLPSFYFLLAIIMIGFAYGLPKLRALIPHHANEKDLFESEVRIIFALMIGVVVTFELLGLHPIIAGFFAGLVLSESIKSEILMEKLRTMSYGIFIPVFFVVIGMETNIGVFQQSVSVIGLIAAVVFVSVFTKFISGWIGGKIIGFKNKESAIIGLATIPQLSTTLAVVFTAVETGLLPEELITAMVILSIATTLIAPIGLRLVSEKKARD